MASTDPKSGEPIKTEKEYIDIIKSEIKIDKKFIKNEGISTQIVYYCKECKKLVNPKRIAKKFQFTCPNCKKANVAFGSKESITNYYKIKGEKGLKTK